MVVYVVVNYSLDVFHTQTVTNIYGIFMDATLLLNTLSLPIMAYVIITQLSKMGPYKWFLLNGLIWDYFLELIISLWQPVLLFPFYMAYVNGLLKYVITQRGCYSLLAIGIISFINMGLNQAFSFLYRLATISPFKLLYFFETPRLIFPTMALVHILCYILFVLPLIFLRSISLEDWARAIETEAPVLIQFLVYPGIFGSPYHVSITVIMRVMAGVLIGGSIFLTCCCLFFYYKLQKWKPKVSISTYKMQKMLFAALVSQTINIIIFLIIPISIVLVTASSRFPYSSYMAILGISIVCLHGLADIIAIIYFIKPYREFFLRLVKIIFKKISSSSHVSQNVTTVSSIQLKNQPPLSSMHAYSQLDKNLRKRQE